MVTAMHTNMGLQHDDIVPARHTGGASLRARKTSFHRTRFARVAGLLGAGLLVAVALGSTSRPASAQVQPAASSAMRIKMRPGLIRGGGVNAVNLPSFRQTRVPSVVEIQSAPRRSTKSCRILADPSADAFA